MLGSAGTETSTAASEAAEAFLTQDAGVMNMNMLSMQAAECSRVMEALVDPDELSVTTSMADMISDLFNTHHTSKNSLSSSSSNNNNNNNNVAAAAMSAQDLFAVLDLFDAEADAEAVPLIDTESVDTTAVSHEFDLSCVVSKMHRTTSLSPLGRERNETPAMICQNESGGGGGGAIMKRKSSGNPSDFSESETDTTASGSQQQQQQKRSKTCSSSPSVCVIDGEGGEGTGHRMTHIAVERNRRKQMNEHLAVLRSLMPGFYVQRGDQASIIGGVIDFIKELQQLLASLESQKQRKAYADALSPRPCSSPRPPVSPRTPPPQLSSSGNRRLPHAVACNSSAASMAEVKELVAHCKSAVADVEVKIAGCNALLKTLSHRIPGQTIRIVSALEQLSLEILHLNISTMDDTVLNSFTLKIGIECKLSVEELAQAVQQTFCSCPC